MRSVLVLCILAAGGAAAADASIKVDRLKGGLPPGVKATGPTLDQGYYFGDKNGLNYVLFSSKEVKGDPAMSMTGLAAKYIFVDHWAVPPGGKPRLLRTVKELLEQCEGEMDLAFHDGAFTVTDLDGDGKAEVTFAYETACRSDVSAATYKLLLLEDGTKYILRGTTRIEENGGADHGGAYTPDPDRKKWPAAFYKHATELWDRTADDLEIPPRGGPTPGSMDDPGPRDPNPCGG